MRQWFIGKSVDIITECYPLYEKKQIDRIRYGLESVYMTFTKIFVILLLSMILGILKETCLLMIFYNFLRWTGFGIHATKSWICWLVSISIFITIPFICKCYIIPDSILTIFSILSILCFCFYAPADTEKRPLLNKKKRLIYRVSTIFTGVLYFFAINFIEEEFLRNIIFFALVIESIVIHPLTYKIFHLPYQNYCNYQYPSI